METEGVNVVARKKSEVQLDAERSAIQIAADGLEMIAKFSSAEMDALEGELLKRCEQKKKRPRADSWALAQRAFVKLQPMLDDYGAKSMKHITSRSVERELLDLVRDVVEAGDNLSPYFARIDAASMRLRRLRRSMEELSPDEDANVAAGRRSRPCE